MATSLALDLTTYANGNSQNVVLTKPANVADGDYLFAAIVHRTANGVWTVPSGWTAVGVSSEDYVDVKVYYKRIVSAASEVATSYTWTTNKAVERAMGIMWRQTNVDPATVVDATGTAAVLVSNTTTLTLPAVTATSNHATLVAVICDTLSGGGTPPDPSVPVGMSVVGNVNAATSAPNSLRLKVATQALAASGSSGTRAATFSPAASGRVGFMFTVSPLGPPDPSLVLMRQALPEVDTVRVLSRTAYVTTGVRMAASTSPSMSSPVYSSSVVPDADGYAKHTLTGLSPDTPYWFRMELDGAMVTSLTGAARTLPAVGPASFSFIVGSCTTTTGQNNVVFDVMRQRTGPDGLPARFVAHLGDVHYDYASYSANGTVMPDDAATVRASYENSLSTTRQQALWQDVPISHTYSDNDFGGSNSDSTTPARNTIVQVRRQIFHDPPLPDAEGIYRSWVVGRVRFIQTDSRTFMPARGTPDTAGKSMLGTTQKSWLKAQLLKPEPLKVWMHDQAWCGPAQTPNASSDQWTVHNSERVELGQFIATNAVPVVYLHGDTHRLSVDSGAGNSWGGFPTIGSAPFAETANASGSFTPDVGIYPTSGTVNPGNLYGWFDVTDASGVITLTYSGYDSGGTKRLSYSRSWNVPATLSVWDGTSEVAATLVGVWDGTQVVPATIDDIV